MEKNLQNLVQQPTLRTDNTPLQSLSQSESLCQYLRAATSNNTRKTYRSAIKQFEKWGGRLPTDRETIVRYLLDRAQSLNPQTLDLHLTAISQWHHVQGITGPAQDPLVKKAMDGIRRVHGRPKRKAKALRLEHLAAIITHLRQLPDSKKKCRDIALLLTGFFGAFRRSELVTIQVADLAWEPEGLIVQLKRSKTDQDAKGIMRALPLGDVSVCPVTALKTWLEVAEIKDGPIFRPVNRWNQIQAKPLNPSAINEILKALGTACGFDFVLDLSSHSFRRGLSTSAAREHVDFELIKKQGGWRSDATVWEYIEEGQQLNNNAAVILMEKMAGLLSAQSLS